MGGPRGGWGVFVLLGWVCSFVGGPPLWGVVFGGGLWERFWRGPAGYFLVFFFFFLFFFFLFFGGGGGVFWGVPGVRGVVVWGVGGFGRPHSRGLGCARPRAVCLVVLPGPPRCGGGPPRAGGGGLGCWCRGLPRAGLAHKKTN